MLLFLLGLFDVLAPLEDRFCEETNHSMVMGTPLRKFQTQILSRLVACNHFINREFVLNKRKKKKDIYMYTSYTYDENMSPT